MICPYCAADNDRVIDSRASEGGLVIRRRRECAACHKRYTTYERVEKTHRLMVVKRDGSRVPFNQDNILQGVQSACGKRPIARRCGTRRRHRDSAATCFFGLIAPTGAGTPPTMLSLLGARGGAS